jgi:methyl-accepting chemotaxis protein
VDAAARVENDASAISDAATHVGQGSVEQVRAIENVNESMGRITGQVAEIAGASKGLARSVSESAAAINQIRSVGVGLDESALELTGKADSTAVSMEQMNRTVSEVAKNTDSLFERAMETAASMDEMAAGVRSVAEHASETSRLSSEVVKSADKGQERVRETMVGMETIREAVESAQEVIRNLDRKGDEIGEIISVIDGVADETGLLALNAAIIAAQAGAHGRSFAVVADEIKDLAGRVLQNTKEIGDVIRSLQEEGTRAVGCIERGAESVQAGLVLCGEAGVSLEEITAAARESGDQIHQIVAAMEQQSHASQAVATNMDGVKDEIERIRAAGEEQVAGSKSVLENTQVTKEVAHRVQHTASEQTTSAGRLAENLDRVKDVAGEIDEALTLQTEDCQRVATFVGSMSELNETNADAAEKLAVAVMSLSSQAQQLRDHVHRFKLEGDAPE